MTSSSARQASSYPTSGWREYKNELDLSDDSNSYKSFIERVRENVCIVGKACPCRYYEHIRNLKDKPNSYFEILFKVMNDSNVKRLIQAILNQCITSYEKADTAAFELKLEKIENMWSAVSKHLALKKPLFYKFDNRLYCNYNGGMRSSQTYVLNPKSFRVRVWNPVRGFDVRLKYLELYLVAIGAFIDMCIELLYSTHLKFFVNGVLNASQMNDFEHGRMLLMFFIYSLVILLPEKTSFFPLPEGALSFIAATTFCAEYLLFYFHSTTHKGLEGHYHLLVLLVAFCILSSIAGALMQTSFAADLSSGIAIALQGLWFYQTAFTLCGPSMPDGCKLKDNGISCNSADHEVQGQLLANFQLFTIVLGVMVGVVGSYGFAAKRYGQVDIRSLQG